MRCIWSGVGEWLRVRSREAAIFRLGVSEEGLFAGEANLP